MLWGGNIGVLELRSEGGETRLRAVFPYGAETELAPGRREIIAPRAFAARIESGEDIHLLSGHTFDKPLASRAAGTLTLRDTDAALEVDAKIDGGTSWARDFLAANAAGLIRGLSPGFQVPNGGEKIERRASGVLRTITAAMHPNLGKSPDELTPDLGRAQPGAMLEAARGSVLMAYGVLPGMLNPATTGPLIREGQRHLAGWVLQPIAELVAEEASRKLGGKVVIDVGRPLQAFDAGGRARALSQLIEAMGRAKELGLSPAEIGAAFKSVNMGGGDDLA